MRALAALLAVAAAAATFGSAAASASSPPLSSMPAPTGAQATKTQPDAGTTIPNGMAQGSPSTGGVSPMTATPDSGYYTCVAPVANPVANVPSGYVTGECMNGWQLHSNTWDDLGGDYWEGGYINGNYAGCGWLNFANTNWQSGTAATNCTPPSTNIANFIYQANGSYYIWTDSSGTDGVLDTPKATCPVYANFRPWLSGQSLSQQIDTISPSRQVKMRYLAKNPSSSGIYYTMIHDPYVASGGGNWGFVNSGCL